jgi:site-specific DNA-methyltransferase (adenine-specific)
MAQRDALTALEQPDALVYRGFRLEDRRLVPMGTPSREEWSACLDYLMHIEQHVHFWIGDLLAYGEKRWGTTYADMVGETGYDIGTLQNLKWVASKVDAEQRRETLSFAHHQEVVRLSPAQQDRVLTLAEDEGWTRDMVRQEAYRVVRSEQPASPSGDDNPSLYHGDCREILAQLPDASIDLLLTDPPYGLNYTSPARTLPFAPMVNDDGDEAFEVLDGALAIATSKLKPDSHVYVFTCWKTYRQMAAVVREHFTLSNVLVWVKNNWGVGDLEGGYGEQQELILFAQKGSRPLNGAAQSNVLPFSRVGTNQLQHPTQKPVDLLAYLIAKSSDKGGLVVDPFMGSGSTCIAARNIGRRYLGVDIDQQWYELALQRLADPREE